MDYKVIDMDGYSPQIGHLVSQMNYVRETTLHAVKGLTTTELDYLIHNEANSIGALLLHMAAVEKGFQIEFFVGRRQNEQEMAEWGAAYSLGNQGRQNIKGHSLDFYIEKLNEVRERTLSELAKRDDAWLYEDCLWDNHPSNHYFIWFHVFEDEINHRGQIRVIRNSLKGMST